MVTSHSYPSFPKLPRALPPYALSVSDLRKFAATAAGFKAYADAIDEEPDCEPVVECARGKDSEITDSLTELRVYGFLISCLLAVLYTNLKCGQDTQ